MRRYATPLALAGIVAALCASGCAQTAPGSSAAFVRHSTQPSIAGLIPADAPAPTPAWSDTVDFLALREAYGARVDFEERCAAAEIHKRVVDAIVAERHEDVVAATAAGLEQCPVWPQLHLWRAASLHEQGRHIESDIHLRWFMGLTQSVLDSGDGKTAETPYVTISTGEEYAVLTRLGLEPKGQALVGGKRRLDLITAVDEAGQESSIYFEPAWHFVRLMHAFGPL